MALFKGNREYFTGVNEIKFEGLESDNPLAFKFYNPTKIIRGKSMKEHLRFAVAYWHSFCGTGADPFGGGTRTFPWEQNNETKMDAMTTAMNKLDAAFEFFSKLSVPYYCFHDRDISPEAETLKDSINNLEKITGEAKLRQKETGIKLLWGTANLFSHPRFMNGAATNPEFKILASGASQVKAAIDATVELEGENYVFWGGREGYGSLLNTDMALERENMARFLSMARDYGRKAGFKGTFLIEPKPMEPTKHQYDFDAATVIGFLKEYDLHRDFKLNIEANHATLAGHSFTHELQVCADANMLGSIDANRGDAQNGWDTDQFPVDIYQTVEAMMVVLNAGGLGSGGLNFDAKLRRNSTDTEDLFIAHIGGMDAFARGLEVADSLLNSNVFSTIKSNRYSSYKIGDGLKFTKGELDFEQLATIALKEKTFPLVSGRQELLENIINQYLFR
ncbi:MAG: xylose isomerase [Deltaproteobacteria bacterium]|nr:xylose isomerase [Deltaproteobacteria bacterium]